MKAPTVSDISRFQKFTKNLENGCVQFTGGRGVYGMFWFDGKTIGAHQFAYMAFVGPTKPGMCVCHRCDYPLCVNPEHLFIGTHKENTLDMVKKGRNNPPAGSRQHRSKLKELDVLNIHALAGTMPQRQIARLYGLNQSCISGIVRGITWKHVKPSRPS